MTLDRYLKFRDDMVERQIAASGVHSQLVLQAMLRVRRDAFVPEHLRDLAYRDTALPIGYGQTISQPYIVALMTEALALSGGETVLEIGTGSGYGAAVLAEIASEVFTLERIAPLAEKAAATLIEQGYRNVHVYQADGSLGWSDHAPYDAIVLTAGSPQVPASLKAQLKIGGRLVLPVGATPQIQRLLRVTRISETDYRSETLADVCFVPLLGREGWPVKGNGPVAAKGDAGRDPPDGRGTEAPDGAWFTSRC